LVVYKNIDSKILTGEYQTIAKPSQGFFKAKGSKFEAYAFAVINEDDIKLALEKVKLLHPKAGHHCYAWKLGLDNNHYRANDDGEPGGTAGKPIFGQIRSFNVTNVLIVVVRYFGGTLLGVSGLIEAYKMTAQNALNNAEIVTKHIMAYYTLAFGYEKMNEVMTLIKNKYVDTIDKQFNESCVVKISVKKSDISSFESAVSKIDNVTLNQIGIY